MSEERKEYSRQYKIDVTLNVFLEMVQGKALQEPPIKIPEEIKELSRWTGVPASELVTKTTEELEKIAPFVLEVEATGEPIELKTAPITLDGYASQGDGVVTLNGKPINEVKVTAGEKLELVIPAGYHSVGDTFKGFKAKKLVLMSRAMLGGERPDNDIYVTISEIAESAFRYATAKWKFCYAFYNCTSLTSIPENLFVGVQGSATRLFSSTFLGCTSLTTIPKGLFAGVQGCAERMFESTFGNCESLTSIPEGLFAGVQGSAKYMFWDTFNNCKSLATIPEGLFAGVQGSAESLFSGTFSRCYSLTSIPEGLFAGVQGSAESLFSGTFYGCSSLTGTTPKIQGKKLWEASAGDDVGLGCFGECNGLSDYDEIPDDWK